MQVDRKPRFFWNSNQNLVAVCQTHKSHLQNYPGAAEAGSLFSASELNSIGNSGCQTNCVADPSFHPRGLCMQRNCCSARSYGNGFGHRKYYLPMLPAGEFDVMGRRTRLPPPQHAPRLISITPTAIPGFAPRLLFKTIIKSTTAPNDY